MKNESGNCFRSLTTNKSVADYCGSFKLLALSDSNISHDICQYFVRQIKKCRGARLWWWNRSLN